MTDGGKRLGKYQIMALVARSANGDVHQAYDPVTGRTVALKTVPLRRIIALAAPADGDAALARFRTDLQAAARLIHLNIATILGSGEVSGMAYIAMDWVNGVSLRRRLETDARPSSEWSLGIAAQLLSALDHAHRNGVVHGHLTASHLLIEDDEAAVDGGRLRVIGFGSAERSTGSPGAERDLKAAAAILRSLLDAEATSPALAALTESTHRSAADFLGAVEAARASLRPSVPRRRRRGGLVSLGVALALATLGGVALLPSGLGLAPRSDPGQEVGDLSHHDTDNSAVVGRTSTTEAPPPLAASPSKQEPSAEDAPPTEPTDNTARGDGGEPPPDTAAAPSELAQPAGTAQTTPAPWPVEVVSGLRSALGALPCAVLDVAVDGTGRLTISGTTAQVADPSRIQQLVESVADGRPFVTRVGLANRSLCEPLDLIAPLRALNAGQTAPSSLIATQIGASDGAYVAGQALQVEVKAPGPALILQVDYFMVDGTVVHLLPNPLETSGKVAAGKTRRLGDPMAGGRYWTVGPPFGVELIMVVATETPLFATPRLEAESASAYLADLKAALASAGPTARADARFIVTRAAPP